MCWSVHASKNGACLSSHNSLISPPEALRSPENATLRSQLLMFSNGLQAIFQGIVGPVQSGNTISEHGDAYRRISYDRDGKTVLHDRASVVCGAWDTILGTSCIVQGTFAKGNGFPKICLRLASLLPRRQNHHPRVLPKAFQWKVVSMCKSSR